jgi:predicted Zn-dependent protease with MMP-like domain
MNRPKTIKLGAFEWGVVFNEITQECAQEFDNEPENVLGFTDRRNLVMYIDETLTPQVLKSTFLHELVHAMGDSFGLGFEDTENENAVNKIANAFYNFIKQNPKAVEWLIKEE